MTNGERPNKGTAISMIISRVTSLILVIGLLIIGSIFVNKMFNDTALASDNGDKIEQQLASLEQEINDLRDLIVLLQTSHAELVKAVYEDSETGTPLINEQDSARLPREELLYTKPYIAVGNASNFRRTGNDRENAVKISVSTGETNYVAYTLNGLASTFKATLAGVAGNSHRTAIISVYGDGHILYESPELNNESPPIPLEIDISGIIALRIQVESTSSISGTDISGEFRNAVIVIAE